MAGFAPQTAPPDDTAPAPSGVTSLTDYLGQLWRAFTTPDVPFPSSGQRFGGTQHGGATFGGQRFGASAGQPIFEAPQQPPGQRGPGGWASGRPYITIPDPSQVVESLTNPSAPAPTVQTNISPSTLGLSPATPTQPVSRGGPGAAINRPPPGGGDDILATLESLLHGSPGVRRPAMPVAPTPGVQAQGGLPNQVGGTPAAPLTAGQATDKIIGNVHDNIMGRGPRPTFSQQIIANALPNAGGMVRPPPATPAAAPFQRQSPLARAQQIGATAYGDPRTLISPPMPDQGGGAPRGQGPAGVNIAPPYGPNANIPPRGTPPLPADFPGGGEGPVVHGAHAATAGAAASIGSKVADDPVTMASIIKQLQQGGFGNNAQNFWLALAQAGFAMAASKSPFLGQAIGEGASAGLSAYQESRARQAQQLTAAADLALRRQELEQTQAYRKKALGIQERDVAVKEQMLPYEEALKQGLTTWYGTRAQYGGLTPGSAAWTRMQFINDLRRQHPDWSEGQLADAANQQYKFNYASEIDRVTNELLNSGLVDPTDPEAVAAARKKAEDMVNAQGVPGWGDGGGGGGGSAQLPPAPATWPDTVPKAAPKSGPGSSQDNPIVPKTQDEINAAIHVPGLWVKDNKGNVVQVR